MHAEIQKIVDDTRARYDIPGVAVSINFGANQNDYVSGTTTIRGTIPLHSNHLFQVGSITKLFTAILMLQLDAQNLLSVNDYITKWLPLEPLWEKVTIKQLLNHSSGIYNYTDTFDEIMSTDRNIDLDKQWSTEELFSLAAAKPLYFPPGQGWHYSNSNYAIAGRIIEVVTRNSLAKEMKKRFFSPLRLSNTYYCSEKPNQQILQQMASGYSRREYFPDEPKDITNFNLSWASAGGSIISTAHDIANMLSNLVSGTLLPHKQLNDLMTTIPINDDPTSTLNKNAYGLGIQNCFDSSGEWWGHSGGTLGYTALACWYKSADIVIVVTANHISTNRDVYLIVEELMKVLVA